MRVSPFPIKILTDYKGLENIEKKKVASFASTRVQHFLDTVFSFEARIKYIPGHSNSVDDFPLCLPHRNLITPDPED